ncbi:MAG TPA: FG-GAP repeat protein [Chthoniobacterales bacterium]
MKLLHLVAVMIGLASAKAGDLHPIVQVETGYLFGAVADGKWIKADQASKSLTGQMTYRMYGLTQSIGEAKGTKPKPSEEEVCSDMFVVSLSPKPKNGAIAIAAPWNALPRKVQSLDKTQKAYVDAVRDFLRTKGIEQPKVKIDNIVRVDLNGDGEEEVLISATNYFSKEKDVVPMRSPAGSYSMVLLRRVVAGKVETQLVEGEFHPKAYVRKDDSFDAPNVYTLVAALDLDGDGKMEIVINSSYYEGGSTTIYRCRPNKVEKLLAVACGV